MANSQLYTRMGGNNPGKNKQKAKLHSVIYIYNRNFTSKHITRTTAYRNCEIIILLYKVLVHLWSVKKDEKENNQFNVP